MEVVVMPQLGSAGSSSASILRYKIVEQEVVDANVKLADRSVNVVAVASSDALRVILPEKVEGHSRDLLARFDVSGSTAPEISFVGANGEEIVIEDDGGTDLECKVGANVYIFTETAPGKIFVMHKILTRTGGAE